MQKPEIAGSVLWWSGEAARTRGEKVWELYCVSLFAWE